jgi:predicted dinucleotide-binding enzyme
MKIGILGAGTVGQYFARAVLPHGHRVMLSSRTPDSDQRVQLADALGPDARIGTVAETLAFGDVIAVALPWNAIPDVVNQGDWSGKIVIDMTNRFGGDHAASAAEDLARMIAHGASGAQVVKALNHIGAEHYVDPVFDGQAATMFIAGDNAEAKQIVGDLVGQIGFEVIDVGDLSQAVHLEALAALWVHLAFRAGQGRDVAFKLLRK